MNFKKEYSFLQPIPVVLKEHVSMQGFLLGIANGTLCLGYCAPVLVPYLLGESTNVRGNISRLGRFLVGRLLGYFCFATLVWMTSWVILHNTAYRNRVLALTYITLAVLLLIYTFLGSKKLCAVNVSKPYFTKISRHRPALIPVGLGIATGINICPPFLLIFTEAANTASFIRSTGF
jgi:sulfite exporter TauE/SafE